MHVNTAHGSRLEGSRGDWPLHHDRDGWSLGGVNGHAKMPSRLQFNCFAVSTQQYVEYTARGFGGGSHGRLPPLSVPRRREGHGSQRRSGRLDLIDGLVAHSLLPGPSPRHSTSSTHTLSFFAIVASSLHAAPCIGIRFGSSADEAYIRGAPC